MYSSQLLDHFEHPRNVGELEPPAITVEVTNPACGDILRLSARIENGVITEVAYKVKGCTASIAAGSALTEMMKGKSIIQLRQINTSSIEQALDGLEPASQHAAVLCFDALKRLY